MRRWIAFLLIFLLGAAPGLCQETGAFVVEDNEELVTPDIRHQARALLQRMTKEEKIGQLFFVSLEDLTEESRSTDLTKTAFLLRYPVGGVMLFGQNIVSETQLKQLTDGLQARAVNMGMYPLFIGVDEEGGSVSRVANKLGYMLAPSPGQIGASGRERLARSAGEYIAAYLKPLGINLTFAPSADTVVDKDAVGVQTYGADPAQVSRMTLAMAEGLSSGGVIPCWGHFPGQGVKIGTAPNHLSISRKLEEMRLQEWIPFRNAIRSGADMILVSHAIVRAVGDDKPASLSSSVIQGLLRRELEFDGVVVADSLRMTFIARAYSDGLESVAALKAGADMLLLPPDLPAAIQAVQQAVARGELTMSRIEDSVERILAVKIRAGLIQ